MGFSTGDNTGKYRDILKQVLMSQQVGTLATLDREQPYTSLVAYAVNKDLKTFVFVTAGNTRKYNNIINNSKVSVLVHDFGGDVASFSKAAAVTILGTAQEAVPRDLLYLTDLYLEKHRNLENFVRQPGNKLVTITVRDYIIATFHETKHLYAQDL
jgi:uncharacterized pyridoxamine 5'-phosphate oxidase family protein